MKLKIYVVCPECHGKGHVIEYVNCLNCDGRGEALDVTHDHPKAKRIEVIA